MNCVYCNAKYISGSGEGSMYDTDPITFECGSRYVEDKVIQTEECQKIMEERFQIKANMDVTEYIMGMKDLDSVLENSPVIEMPDPEEKDPAKKKIIDLFKRIDGK
jgi:hypothetical protein